LLKIGPSRFSWMPRFHGWENFQLVQYKTKTPVAVLACSSEYSVVLCDSPGLFAWGYPSSVRFKIPCCLRVPSSELRFMLLECRGYCSDTAKYFTVVELRSADSADFNFCKADFCLMGEYLQAEIMRLEVS